MYRRLHRLIDCTTLGRSIKHQLVPQNQFQQECEWASLDPHCLYKKRFDPMMQQRYWRHILILELSCYAHHTWCGSQRKSLFIYYGFPSRIVIVFYLIFNVVFLSTLKKWKSVEYLYLQQLVNFLNIGMGISFLT